MTFRLSVVFVAVAAAAVLAACGGGGSSSPPPAPPTATASPAPAGTPTPIPLGSPSSAYYVSAISAANGVPAYISDPIVLTFSQQPDYSGANTTEAAITVTPLTPSVPTPLATGFITAASAPNEIGVKFYAQAGASYRISIGPTAKSASGTTYGGISQFIVTLPTTPPIPAPVQPQPGSVYFYGLNPGTLDSATQSWLSQLKPKIVRVGVYMGDTEPSSGTFSFTSLDTALAQAKTLGIAVDLLLVQYNAPNWANGFGSSPTPLPAPRSGYIACTPSTFASWAQAVVAHVTDPSQHSMYSYPAPAAIEIGNEPNTPNFWVVDSSNPACALHAFTSTKDPRPYLPYLQQAYTAAKSAVATGSPVFLNAGVATNADDETYFANLVGLASGSVDAWAVHLYAWSDPNSPLAAHDWEAFKVLTDDMSVAGPSKPFWVTEGAFTTNPYCYDGVDAQTQAYFLVEDYNKMAALTEPSVASFLYFELEDQNAPAAPSGSEDPCFEPGGTGLVDSGGTARPAFQAFANLAQGL